MKLFFILTLIAVVAMTVALFTENTGESVLKKQSADNSLLAAQLNAGEPLPLLITEKESAKEREQQAREKQKNEVARERQKNAEKLALLAAQLTQLEEQNKALTAHINSLDSELAAKQSYISVLQENNRELQWAQAEQSQALLSEADLLKNNIQRQPDLVKSKAPASKVEPAPGNDAVVLDNQAQGDFSGAVEFGFSYAQDNQVTRALNGRLVLDYAIVDLFTLNSNLKLELKEEDNAMTTEKYRWQLQADSYLDPRNFVFARSDMQRSQFASYDKEDIYTIGYGRILFDLPKHKFNIEIGPGYRMAEPNVGKDAVSVNEFIVRSLVNYERIVSESLQIKMGAVMEVGRENSIYGVSLKAQNKIYRELYLIFNSDYKYTENVPVDTLNKEVTSGLTLMYAF